MNRLTTTLLRGLLLPEVTARSHLEEWCRNTDLQDVDSATHPLLPLLYRRLVDIGLSPPQLERLRGVYRKTWYQNQRHLAALKRVMEVLLVEQVEATLVEGLALSLGAYQDLGLRMVDAAQVVVPPHSIVRVVDGLMDAGLEAEEHTRMIRFGLPIRMTDKDGGRIDIRGYVYGPGWSGLREEELWKRRVTIPFNGLPMRTLAPSDAVAKAVASGLTTPNPTYQWLIDLAMLSKQTTPTINWAELIHNYRDTLLSVPIREAMLTMEAEVPGALAPESGILISEMSATRKQHLQFWFYRRGRRFARLPTWHRRLTRLAGEDQPVRFTAFVKSAYGVDSMAEALVKGIHKIRRRRRWDELRFKR